MMRTGVRPMTPYEDAMIRSTCGQDIAAVFNRTADYWVVCQVLPEARPMDKLLIGCATIRGPLTRYKALFPLVTSEGVRLDPEPFVIKGLLDQMTRRADDPRNEKDLCWDSPEVPNEADVPDFRTSPKAADAMFDEIRETTPEFKDREKDAIDHLLPIEFGGRERKTVVLPGEPDPPPVAPKKLILPRRDDDGPVETDWNDDGNW